MERKRLSLRKLPSSAALSTLVLRDLSLNNTIHLSNCSLNPHLTPELGQEAGVPAWILWLPVPESLTAYRQVPRLSLRFPLACVSENSIFEDLDTNGCHQQAFLC